MLPGARRTLEQLAADGFLLGLTTGNVEVAAFAKLHRGGLHQFFCFGGYGSDSADRGELTRIAIRRAEGILGMKVDSCGVLVVGDTPKDVAAAKAARATSVAVATGRYSQADLHHAGAHYVLATREEPFPGAIEAVVETPLATPDQYSKPDPLPLWSTHERLQDVLRSTAMS